MRRTLLMLACATALVALATACGHGATNRPVAGVSATPTAFGSGGDALSPVKGRRTLFVVNDAKPFAVRDATRKIVEAIPPIEGLHTAGMSSTDDTAAVIMVEDPKDPNTPWGSLLSEAEPAVFTAFADDPTAGKWLILVTDVVVHVGQDPIPPTAYRWTRAEVADYVKCGNPPTAECRTAFFKAADSVVLAEQGGPLVGK